LTVDDEQQMRDYMDAAVDGISLIDQIWLSKRVPTLLRTRA